VEQFTCFWSGKIVLPTIILIQGLALLLTFSKSAIIALFIGLFYLYVKKCSAPALCFENVPRGTFSKFTGWNIFSIFKTNNFYKKVLLIISIVILIFFILKPNLYLFLFKSLREREFYLNVSRGTFLSHPLIGIGAGQFIANMQNIANIQAWQYQPVHNVFLLILNEFGIVMLFLFLYFMYKIFCPSTNAPLWHKCSTWNIIQYKRETLYGTGQKNNDKIPNLKNTYFKAILVSFVFIMLFDHYFWDIQQGQIILWFVFGVIASEY
jgi:hypothetical protein